ncbi:MAG: hypothetical protein NVS3B12_04950 [Acidimicrobiales bacterium]
MYGSGPSEAGIYAAARFVAEGLTSVVELGVRLRTTAHDVRRPGDVVDREPLREALDDFEEGGLPRRLWRVTMRRT